VSAELKAALAALLAEPLQRREIKVAGKSVPIFLKPISAEAAEAVYVPLRDHEGRIAPENRSRMAYGLVAATVTDETGAPLFTADEVAGWPQAAYAQVSALVMQVNGLGDGEGNKDPNG
jgi:hypothetical protein